MGKLSRAKRKALRKKDWFSKTREKSDIERLFALFSLFNKLGLEKSYTMVNNISVTVNWVNTYGKA